MTAPFYLQVLPKMLAMRQQKLLKYVHLSDIVTKMTLVKQEKKTEAKNAFLFYKMLYGIINIQYTWISYRFHSTSRFSDYTSSFLYISLLMRKPVYAICDQQRCRSACAFAQSDQHLCCSLPKKYNISSFYICNFMTLASFFS